MPSKLVVWEWRQRRDRKQTQGMSSGTDEKDNTHEIIVNSVIKF